MIDPLAAWHQAISGTRGIRVLSRDEKDTGLTTGGTRDCQLESCGRTRIGVRWPDGQLTWPCSKGMAAGRNGTLKIL